MKGFDRDYPWLSLCGLKCRLCTLYMDQYCPGCGGGEGNQSCAIARCSLSHGGVTFCSQCGEFPCARYEQAEEYDSFITHRNKRRDLEKVLQIGRDAYGEEQEEKEQILKQLLAGYNDGRRKSFFCVAVNLLKLQDLREIMGHLESHEAAEDETVREKAVYAVKLFQERAAERGLELKLRRKPGKKK